MVRRHLDALVEQGHASAGESAPFGPRSQRGRGRPAKVYSLTSSGRDAFDQNYDDVAIGALRFLADRHGDDAVLEFARQRVAELERRYAPVVAEGESPSERLTLLATALTDDGFAAGVTPASTGAADQLCQHHCPVAHVAEEFPQFCEAETEAFERLLGSHVTRLATIGHGDGVCTTHVPRSEQPHQRTNQPTTTRSAS